MPRRQRCCKKRRPYVYKPSEFVKYYSSLLENEEQLTPWLKEFALDVKTNASNAKHYRTIVNFRRKLNHIHHLIYNKNAFSWECAGIAATQARWDFKLDVQTYRQLVRLGLLPDIRTPKKFKLYTKVTENEKDLEWKFIMHFSQYKR